jgi:hypothetical protein
MNSANFETLRAAFLNARRALVQSLFEEAFDFLRHEGLDLAEASSIASDLGCQLSDPTCPLLAKITTAGDGLAYLAAVIHRQKQNQDREEIRHRRMYRATDVELLETELAKREAGHVPLPENIQLQLNSLVSRLKSVSSNTAVFLLFQALFRPDASIRQVARELGYAESDRRKVARELRNRPLD